jgi:methylphosphotriester-DNA--protein-cysteine methyltransferase
MSKQKKGAEETKNETVRVCIRCRPMNDDEIAQGHNPVVNTTERGEIFVQKPFVEEPPK